MGGGAAGKDHGRAGRCRARRHRARPEAAPRRHARPQTTEGKDARRIAHNPATTERPRRGRTRSRRRGDRGKNREQDQRLTATVTATAAATGYQQRPATAHNTRTIRVNWGYVRPEKRKVHSDRTSRPGHRPLGATLGATGANDLSEFRTAMNNGQGRGRGHELI